MQLILNTDTDIGAQKMSTIQQESLDEKFISNNLIETVCSEIADITYGSDESNNQEEEKACEKKINEDAETNAITEKATNEIILNNKKVAYKDGEICDTASVENKEHNELDTEPMRQFDNNKIGENGESYSKDVLNIENNESELESCTAEKDKNDKVDKNMEDDIQFGKIEHKIEEEQNDNLEENSKSEECHKVRIPLKDKMKEQVNNCQQENYLEKQTTENCEQGFEHNKEPITSEDKTKKLNRSSETETKLHRLGEESLETLNFKEQDDINSKIEDEEKKCSDIENNEVKSVVEELDIVEAETGDNLMDQGLENSVIDHTVEDQQVNETKDIVEQDASPEEESLKDEFKNTIPPTLTENVDVDMKSIEDGMNNASDGLDKKTDVLSKEMSEDIEEIEKIDESIKQQTMVEDKNIILDKEEPILKNSKKSKNSLNNSSQTKTIELENLEVIDIADEKDEDCDAVVSEEKEIIEKEPTDNRNDIEKDVPSNENIVRVSGQEINDQEMMSSSKELETSVHEENIEEKVKKTGTEKIVEEKKKLTHLCKLSNTLDILSDEDEDPTQEEIRKDLPIRIEKQCIDVDDDDEVMVIIEESNPKESKHKKEIVTEQVHNVEQNEECETDIKDHDEQPVEIPTSQKDLTLTTENTASDIEMINEAKQTVEEPEENVKQKPLLPLNFLKTCKKNLADMTRDELEEFCILKIVESVVDRSDLSDIKTQLMSMAQNIEEHRKKAAILTKQNRDLQVVLKSVQEEQKKKCNLPITPLKITRSVGMQVLMTDKTGIRRKIAQGSNTPQNNVGSNSPSTRPVKGQANQSSKLQKVQSNVNNTSPIPVPRLVPAVNSTNLNNSKIQQPNANLQAKAQAGQVATPVSNSPNQAASNGLPTLTPAPKAEKRPHSRMQQANSSVTVDLTDDEPPAKVIQRNIPPPVRLVPPQNLLAPHRQPFGTNVNSPRKVYIPISGSQNQGIGVRAGQTIMLKTLSPQGPRLRCQAPAASKSIATPPTNTVRMQRIPSRHPAPLPDSVKQYQPVNWKSLPPAPELKLSKVENGIVISWKIDGYQEDNYEEIASYQLYAYQETSSPPSTALWKKIGDVKALPLPMACTLTQFMAGYKYYFAVRAVDIKSRLGPFSLPGSILLLNKI